eukprot:GHVL01034532.1.p1 GENE.GHVL01034532.1~~GHVL01034532.1.p1  ORF type:complete len:269 (-),score=28.51 GHVL01034532.1:69-875(-)
MRTSHTFLICLANIITASLALRPLTANDLVCYQGDTCVLTFTDIEYTGATIRDSAIISSVECGSATAANQITGYSIADVDVPASPTFTFTSDTTHPVGNFFVCWCDGNSTAAEASCAQPTDQTEATIETNFSDRIGNLLMAPEYEGNALDCASGSCTFTKSYTGYTETDAALITDTEDCSSIAQSNVKGGPVQISGSNTFNFLTVTDFSVSSHGSLCWCYQCFNATSTDHSAYTARLTNVIRSASSAIIGRLSTSLMMILFALTVMRL